MAFLCICAALYIEPLGHPPPHLREESWAQDSFLVEWPRPWWCFRRVGHAAAAVATAAEESTADADGAAGKGAPSASSSSSSPPLGPGKLSKRPTPDFGRRDGTRSGQGGWRRGAPEGRSGGFGTGRITFESC